jgi:hypothetical protein
MTKQTLKQRLARIEAQRNPGRHLVCCCDGAEHAPDCPAAGAGDNDTLWLLRWPDAPRPAAGRIVNLQWDESEAEQ